MIFDLKTFLRLSGQTTGPIFALGSAFGLPSCMLNMGVNALRLIPTPVLASMVDSAGEGRNKADEIVKEVVKKLFLDTGIIEYDTEEGVFKFRSDSSAGKLDNDETELLNTLGGFLNALAYGAGLAGGLYRNYENVSAQIADIKSCIDKYNQIQKFSSGGAILERNRDIVYSDQYFDAVYAKEKLRLDGATRFIQQCDAFISNANAILRERVVNPRLEPVFSNEVAFLLSGTVLKTQTEDDINTIARENDLIRLVFGPPTAKQGQFLLSIDGLYYDSQTSGLGPVKKVLTKRTENLQKGHKWKFEYDPNLGGKGVQISSDKIEQYSNTLFDPDIIDESPYLQRYYDNDHFLQVLIGQKDKQILDISGHIAALEASGAAQAIILNFKQSLMSEATNFVRQINKRKKQIELAVKIPAIYGGTTLFKVGEIPINDFSYLQQYNYATDLAKQKALILDNAEVSGVVLPLEPKFVKSAAQEGFTLSHLYIPEVGRGDIIVNEQVDGSGAANLGITSEIVTDGLFAIYNFLETYTETPSSTNFRSLNCAFDYMTDNAQLVALSPSDVFVRGLGTVYLNGITKHNSALPQYPSALGSYVKLPDSKNFNDWTYSPQGFSFETWMNIPGLNDLATWNTPAQSLYRLILACENTGITSGITGPSNELRVDPNFGSDFVRGMVMGFTRDRRICYDTDPSLSEDLNNPTSSLCFFIAPTQSISSSSVAFLNWTREREDGCAISNGWHKLSIPVRYTNQYGKKFLQSCSDFSHLHVSFDVLNDKITVYLDGTEMAASSLSRVFGTQPYKPLNLPTFKKPNSFEYSSTTVGPYAPLSLHGGPKLNTYFTPWILGGGYTDGMANTGNFMGSPYAGYNSGLKGFLGSVKCYSKPLTASQVRQNYLAQKTLFKNIELWGPCYEEITTYNTLYNDGRSRIAGMVVFDPHYYTQNPYYKNLMAHSHVPIETDTDYVSNASSYPSCINPYTGCPSSLPANRYVHYRIPYNYTVSSEPYTTPSGSYIIQYDGIGSIVLRYFNRSLNVVEVTGITNGAEITLTEAPYNAFNLYIIESNTSDPVRNIKFMETQYAGTETTQPFRENFLSSLKEVSVIRTMPHLHFQVGDLFSPTYTLRLIRGGSVNTSGWFNYNDYVAFGTTTAYKKPTIGEVVSGISSGASGILKSRTYYELMSLTYSSNLAFVSYDPTLPRFRHGEIIVGLTSSAAGRIAEARIDSDPIGRVDSMFIMNGSSIEPLPGRSSLYYHLDTYVKLANTLDCDLWWSIPITLTSESIVSGLTYIKNNLNKTNKLYCELGNENYSPYEGLGNGFNMSGYGYIERGFDLTPSTSVSAATILACEVSRLAQQVFSGEPTRLKTLVNIELWPSPSAIALPLPWTLPLDMVVSGVSAGSYFSSVAFGAYAPFYNAFSVTPFSQEQIVQNFMSGVSAPGRMHDYLTSAITYCRTQRGKEILAYEWGTTFGEAFSAGKYPTLAEVSAVYLDTTAMIPAYELLISSLNYHQVKVHSHFTNVYPWTEFGQWGLQPTIGWPGRTTGRWVAILNEINSHIPSGTNANPVRLYYAPSALENSITLTWEPSCTNNIEIQRLTGTSFSSIATVATGIDTYIDTTVDPASSYHYRIRAYTASGYGPYARNYITDT